MERRRWWIALLVAACCVLCPAAAAAQSSFSQIGDLTNPGTGEFLNTTAVIGGTVFAAATNANVQDSDQGAIFAYQQPAGGFQGASSPSATLVASDPRPDDDLGGVLVADGQSLVAANYEPSGSGQIHIFNQPVGGWSGQVTQSATLVGTNGALLYSPTVSGSTIVAFGQIPRATGGFGPTSLYVFTEPAGGWSGTLSPAAILKPGNGNAVTNSGPSVAIGNGVIAAGDQDGDKVLVYTEPAGGWAGVLSPAGALTTGGPSGTDKLSWSVLFAGSMVIAGESALTTQGGREPGGVYAFDEPAGGWRSEAPSAELVDPASHLAFPGNVYSAESDGITFSGSRLLVPVIPGTQNHLLPSAVEVYTLPPGGWSGTVGPTATLTGTDADNTADGPAGGIECAGFDGPDVIANVNNGSLAFRSASDGLLVNTQPTAIYANVNQDIGTVTPTTQLSAAPDTPTVYSVPSSGVASASEVTTLAEPGGVDTFTRPESVSTDGSSIAAVWSEQQYTPTESSQTRLLIYPQGISAASFTESPVALSDPDGGQFSQVAISGDTVAALTSTQQQSRVDIFTEPSGGWSPNETPTAYINVPISSYVNDLNLSTGTLVLDVCAPNLTCNVKPSFEVYSEPAGGWGDPLEPPAILNVASSANLGAINLDNGTVVIGGIPGGHTIGTNTVKAQVFNEPSGGWSGTVQPAASLTAPYDGGWVFNEPATGWHGTITPDARLAHGSIACLSSDGSELAVADFQPLGKYEPPPGHGTVSVFAAPPSGWHGVITGTSQLETPLPTLGSSDAGQIAGDNLISYTDDQSINIEHYNSIRAQVVPVDRPRLTAAHLNLTGLGVRLTLDLAAGQYGVPFRTVTINLPAGLSADLKPVGLIRQCNEENDTQSCSSPRPGELRIAFTGLDLSFTKLNLTIPTAALHESATFRHKIQAIMAFDRVTTHRVKQSLTLHAQVTAVDGTGITTRRTAYFTIR